MSEADDIVVEIEGEPSQTDGEVKKTETDPVEELKAQHEALKANEERERQAKEAERLRANEEAQKRQAAEDELKTARSEVVESRLSTVEQGLAAAKTEADAAEAAHTAALESGNWAEVSKQQRRMARAEAEMLRLTEAKSDLEVAKTAPVVEKKESPARPETIAGDPVEAYLSAVARQWPKSAEWLRAHPDEARAMATGSNPRRVAKINAAHQDAMGEGIEIDTPEYFAHVEKFLGMETATEKPNGAAKPAPARRATPIAAPVAASAGGTSGGGSEVRLTKAEAQAAQDGTLVWNYTDTQNNPPRFKKGDPIGVQEFARRKRALQEQGAYDRAYVEQ